MPNLASHDLDVSRLLFDLKLGGELVNRFTGWLDPDAIATCFTDGLIEKFGCAFARIWLVDRDRTALRLVASSGLYTRLDGSFARVPMGAFKVGKIAQHCIPFLSNCLPDEDWVKDRDWAIANQIQGFAGLPLMVKDQAIGVLAVFSRHPMAPEFLEVLQILSLSVTGALASALNHQTLAYQTPVTSADNLSEQLSMLLGRQKLSLLGTEQALSPTINHLLIETAKRLVELSCHYCRLVYETDTVILEAMLAAGETSFNEPPSENVQTQIFQDIIAAAHELGGAFQSQIGSEQKVIQIRLQLPQHIDAPSSAGGAIPFAVTDSPLSEREQEVIKLLAEGLRDRDIAEQLYISERTVKFHVKNMLEKLGVKTRIQAVFELTQKGWLR
ncbi:MAG: LuxR C-terminal-related transcriptional regulator [Cyanobacteria bacterium P01_G01_bin.38]